MDPSHAHCRPAPMSRPAAIPLFDAVEWDSPNQPPLPWPGPPEVIDQTAVIPAALRRTARDLASALVETLNGRRPLHQLEPWLSAEVLTLVERLHADQLGRNLQLRSLRIQRPRSDVLEVALHLRHAQLSRAAALRLRQIGRRWQITQLSIAVDPPVIHDAVRLPRRVG
jgi:hypothetical protein